MSPEARRWTGHWALVGAYSSVGACLPPAYALAQSPFLPPIDLSFYLLVGISAGLFGAAMGATFGTLFNRARSGWWAACGVPLGAAGGWTAGACGAWSIGMEEQGSVQALGRLGALAATPFLGVLFAIFVALRLRDRSPWPVHPIALLWAPCCGAAALAVWLYGVG